MTGRRVPGSSETMTAGSLLIGRGYGGALQSSCSVFSGGVNECFILWKENLCVDLTCSPLSLSPPSLCLTYTSAHTHTFCMGVGNPSSSLPLPLFLSLSFVQLLFPMCIPVKCDWWQCMVGESSSYSAEAIREIHALQRHLLKLQSLRPLCIWSLTKCVYTDGWIVMRHTVGSIFQIVTEEDRQKKGGNRVKMPQLPV